MIGDQVLNFKGVSEAVLERKCNSCHNPSRKEGGVDLTDHASLFAGPSPVIRAGDPAGSLLIQVIESGDMPRGGGPRVSSEELEYLKTWIFSGAPLEDIPEENPSPQPNPEPGEPQEPQEPVEDPAGPVDYQRVYREILEPKCSRCHAGLEAEDFVDVTNLEDMKNNFMYPDLLVKGNPAESRLYRAMESGRMPKRGEPVTPAELRLMRLWIFEGPDL